MFLVNTPHTPALHTLACHVAKMFHELLHNMKNAHLIDFHGNKSRMMSWVCIRWLNEAQNKDSLDSRRSTITSSKINTSKSRNNLDRKFGNVLQHNSHTAPRSKTFIVCLYRVWGWEAFGTNSGRLCAEKLWQLVQRFTWRSPLC